MSQLVRQLWQLQKELWLDRNKHLHNDGQSVHAYEMMKVNEAIVREFNIGRDGLSEDFQNTFSGQVETILNKNDI